MHQTSNDRRIVNLRMAHHPHAEDAPIPFQGVGDRTDTLNRVRASRAHIRPPLLLALHQMDDARGNLGDTG